MINVTNRNKEVKVSDTICIFNVDEKFIADETKWLVVNKVIENWSQGEVIAYTIQRIRKDKSLGMIKILYYNDEGKMF